jgi:hypothetical protein
MAAFQPSYIFAKGTQLSSSYVKHDLSPFEIEAFTTPNDLFAT